MSSFLLYLLLATALLTSLALVPVYTFMESGRTDRRQEILSWFSPRAIVEYFRRYWMGVADIKNLLAKYDQAGNAEGDESLRNELTSRFAKLYDNEYGARRYYLSIAVFSLILIALALLASQSALYQIYLYTEAAAPQPGRLANLQRQWLLRDLPLGPLVLDWTSLAALAGGYIWVANDIIRRRRIRDLLPTDLYWHALRLLMTVPLGHAAGAIATASIAPFVAFAAGAFPIDAIARMLQRLFNRNLGLDESATETTELVKLNGIDNAVAMRLRAEGVTTIQHLACVDPIQLANRASMPFEFVLECVNQALAWRYFRDRLQLLELAGLRGAVEMVEFINAFHYWSDPNIKDEQSARAALLAAQNSQDPALIQEAEEALARSLWQKEREEQRSYAHALLPILAAKLACSPEELQNGLEHVAGELYAQFMYRIWD